MGCKFYLFIFVYGLFNFILGGLYERYRRTKDNTYYASNKTCPSELCPKCGNRVWVAGISSECKIVHKCIACHTMYDSKGKIYHA